MKHRTSWVLIPELELVSGYLDDHQSCGSLAKKYGVCDETVRNRLLLLGIARRPRSSTDGRYKASGGYVSVKDPTHPRARWNGRVLEHVRVVERVLGHPLSRKHPVHHANGDESDNGNTNLVVCENNTYHLLLHVRT
jgi:hypothetical protein